LVLRPLVMRGEWAAESGSRQESNPLDGRRVFSYRLTAGALGFLNLSHSGDLPDR
jgi:hypothetical protein